MAMVRSLTLILVLVTLTACAYMVSYKKAVDSLLEASPCCASLSEFNYEPLPAAEPVVFRLDEKSEAFVFPSGKSYFKAFRLPKKEVPYRIQIKSFALGDSIDNAHIFYPQVALLDGDFAVVTQSDPGDFVLRKAGFKETASVSWGMMLKLEGTMQVDIRHARYLVIYTTMELMGYKTSEYMANQTLPIPLTISGSVLIAPLPAGALPVEIPSSPFGLVSLQIESQ